MSHARSVEAVRTRAVSMYWERIEVTAAYEELDETKRMAGVRTIDGERAYQVVKGEPSGFLPCRVRESVVSPRPMPL